MDEYGVTLPCSVARLQPVNILIDAALRQIAERFVSECRKSIEDSISRDADAYPLDDEAFEAETFVNCIDSSVWFDDGRVQAEFEEWRGDRW